MKQWFSDKVEKAKIAKNKFKNEMAASKNSFQGQGHVLGDDTKTEHEFSGRPMAPPPAPVSAQNAVPQIANAQQAEKREQLLKAAESREQRWNGIVANGRRARAGGDTSERLPRDDILDTDANDDVGKLVTTGSNTSNLNNDAQEPIVDIPEGSGMCIYGILEQDPDRARVALTTLHKMLQNIVNDPEEMKYRRIRVNNNAFKNRVAVVPGTLDLLRCCAFTKEFQEGEEYLVFRGLCDLNEVCNQLEIAVGMEQNSVDE